MKLKLFDFYLKAPLYSKIQVNSDNWKEFIYMIQVPTKFEGYNPIHNSKTTYITQDLISGKIENGNLDYFFENGGIYQTSIKCLRYDNVFTFLGKYTPATLPDGEGNQLNIPETGTLEKIGQDVSLAEFQTSKIKSFKKVLSKDKQKELSKAIGLASHGVGIGSFVYLRRIFEHLIEQAHLSAKNKDDWNEKDYHNKRMVERIVILKDYLPDFLVKNKAIYSILSKGIHELNEDLCLIYFDTILLGIERILEAKLDLIKKKQRDKDAEEKIAELNRMLK